jgi:RNA polymerase sigma-70 factor (ECF subfamily)
LSTEATVAPPSPRLEQAFLDLYDREAPVVLAYLRGAAGDDAEDLAAETFLRAWRRWPSYRATDRPVRHWLFRIARNLAIDRMRRRGRLMVLPLLRETGGAGDALAAEVVDRLQLLAALEALAPAERELLAMRAAGLSFAEVGAQLGRTEAAARMAWHRSARRLQAHLER